MAGGGDDAAAGGSVLVVTPTHATAASTQRPSQTTDTVETVKKAKEGSMRGEGSGGLHAVLGAMDRSLYPLRLFFFGSVAVACAYTFKTSQAFVRFNAFHLPSTCLRHPTPLTCNPPVRLDGYIVKACTSHNTLPSTAASSASTSLSSSSPSASESSSSGVLHFYHTPPLRKLLGPFLTLFHPHVDLYTETIPIRLAGVRAAIPDNTGRKGATTMNDGRSHVDDEAVAGDCNHGERISGGPSPPTGGDSESEQAFVALLERKYVQIQLLERLSPPPSSAPSTATSSHATQRFQINNTSITVQNEVMQPVSCLCWPDQSFSVVRWLRGLPPLDAASELLAHGHATCSIEDEDLVPPSFDLLHIDQQGMYEGTLQAYRKAEENAKSQRLGIWQTVARSSSLPSLPDAGQVSSFFSFLLRVVRTLRRNIGPHKDKDMDMDKDKDGAKDNKTQNCRRGTPYEKEEKQER